MLTSKYPRYYNSYTYLLIIVFLMNYLLFELFSPLTAQISPSCKQLLKLAQQKYYEGFFDEAITTIKRCKDSSELSEQEQKRAYRFLAFSYLAKDDTLNARITIVHLLERFPNFKPDMKNDRPDFVQLFYSVRDELQKDKTMQPPKKSSWKKWALFGGGIIVFGTIGYVVLQKKSEKGTKEEPLPLPPALPTKINF